jgi:hypothetical protein
MGGIDSLPRPESRVTAGVDSFMGLKIEDGVNYTLITELPNELVSGLIPICGIDFSLYDQMVKLIFSLT